MSNLTVTIAAARKAGACADGLRWARAHVNALGGNDETPVALADILDAPGGMEWVIWCLPIAEPEADMPRIARLFACDCAERVLPMADDPRSAAAIDVARRYAVGKATDEELAAARAAAWDAAWGAAWGAARGAARAAARAAAWDAARAAAWGAARGAAWGAARDAAWAAAWDAAWAAAWDAARAAAWDAEGEWQAARLRLYLTGAELPPVEPITIAVVVQS